MVYVDGLVVLVFVRGVGILVYEQELLRCMGAVQGSWRMSAG